MKEEQEILGDAFDALVKNVLNAAQQNQDIPPINYLVFSRSKPEPWHVSWFYKDNPEMRRALTSGGAYDLQNFTRKSLSQNDQLKDLDVYIWFESIAGFDADDPQAYADDVSQKLVRMSFGEQDGDCAMCGHDAGEHKLIGPVDEKLGVPTSGWMICPDENCNCFRTWDAALNQEA